MTSTVRSVPRLLSLLALALLALLALSAAGAALANEPPHTTRMQGQILEVADGAAVVCIGTYDGASIGQVLDVVRHVRRSNAPKLTGNPFRRETVGSVRISEIFDEHYSRAEIVTGSPRVNDSVELEAR
jgi:hypothetical protein